MSRACRAPEGCNASVGASDFYCRRDFRQLEAGLLGTLDEIYREAADVYIGRTHYPEQRLLYHRRDHDRDHLAVLHWAGDRAEIAHLEVHLIKAAAGRLKGKNVSDTSDGKWAGHWNCLYVAWTWKARAKPLAGARFTDVSSLDLGRRLLPERPKLVKAPDYLRTRLSADGAARLLARVPSRV